MAVFVSIAENKSPAAEGQAFPLDNFQQETFALPWDRSFIDYGHKLTRTLEEADITRNLNERT